ncbi:MAG: VanZ family protein, partial [Gemmatimonadetes bacterium]|nr:VanZ family protein [Gemmatimonadota bacterium]
LLTVALVAGLGWIDEGIQALLPGRVYDIRDVGFNALAGLMAVGGSVAMIRARRWAQRRKAGPGPTDDG